MTATEPVLPIQFAEIGHAGSPPPDAVTVLLPPVGPSADSSTNIGTLI